MSNPFNSNAFNISAQATSPIPSNNANPTGLAAHSQPARPSSVNFDPPGAPRIMIPHNAPKTIFQRILDHPHLTTSFAAQLDIDSLITLYSQSRTFRSHCHTHWTHLCKLWSTEHAPIFWTWTPFHKYFSLCQPDPSCGVLKSNPAQKRQAASFRYLRFIEFRQKTVVSIVHELAKHGHRLPSHVKVVLAKLWLVMDLPTNAQREREFQGPFFTDVDLVVGMLFIVKLEMRFTSVWDGRSGKLRNLLMAQKGFGRLAAFLRREILVSEADLLVLMAEWKTVMPRAMHERNNHWLGVPMHRMGALGKEHHRSTEAADLVAVDDCLFTECVRRDLETKRMLTSMLLWGYVDNFGRDVDMFLKEGEDEDAIDDIMPVIKTWKEGMTD